jgi:hypothetical protein
MVDTVKEALNRLNSAVRDRLFSLLDLKTEQIVSSRRKQADSTRDFILNKAYGLLVERIGDIENYALISLSPVHRRGPPAGGALAGDG